MSKIVRYSGDVRAFAADALGTERTLFGELIQGDTLDENINLKFLRGWGIVGSAEFPTLEDFNAMGYTLGQLIAYLHQAGVPEWHAGQEYHQYSIAQVNGVIYISLTNNNTGNNPTTDAVNWRKILAEHIAYDNTTSGLVAEDVQAAIDENAAGIAEFRMNWIQAELRGAGLVIATVANPELAALNSTDVAFIDSNNAELRTYRWDGVAWALVGTGLPIAGAGNSALAALNSTDVALADEAGSTLQVYRWDAGAGLWTANGVALTITGLGSPALAALNGADVAFIDGTNDELRTYRFAHYIGTGPYRP